MADIQVNLKAKVDAASAQAAGRQMGETVQRAAGSGKSGPAGSPFAGMSGMKVSDAVALARARAAGGAGGGGGMTPGGAAAMGGAAGGVAAMAVQVINQVVRSMVQAMVSAIQALTNALNRAAALYAKQLQSGGLPGGFIAQRAGLAGIIGVSEDQVWQYGDAVKYLNQRLSFSAKINAETNRSVTGAAWSMRILGEDFKALAMIAANSLAPEIRKVATLMHSLMAGLGPIIVKGIVQIFKSAFEVGLKMVAGSIAVNFLKGFLDKIDPGKAPAASVSSKRLQSSSWERMGLVIGQGVNSNPLKATERNTRQTAVLLKDIRAFLAPRSAQDGPRLARTAVNGA